MLRRCFACAALAFLLTASSVQAQYDTGYYGGGDYRRYYSFGRDYPYNFFGYPYPGPNLSHYFGPQSRETVIYYPAPAETAKPAAVIIDVKLPADAELWIEGKKTSQTGDVRQFISPPLEPGQRFLYDFRIRWKENGRDVTKTRNLDVYAGQRYTVDFVNPPKGPGRIQEFPTAKKNVEKSDK